MNCLVAARGGSRTEAIAANILWKACSQVATPGSLIQEQRPGLRTWPCGLPSSSCAPDQACGTVLQCLPMPANIEISQSASLFGREPRTSLASVLCSWSPICAGCVSTHTTGALRYLVCAADAEMRTAVYGVQLNSNAHPECVIVQLPCDGCCKLAQRCDPPFFP